MQVTVLMPVYNAERFLDDSIGSLLSPDHQRLEINMHR